MVPQKKGFSEKQENARNCQKLPSGFPLTCPDKIPWLSLTFWGEFSLTFPDLCIVVYIQMKQFEDNVSSSTSTKNILAYVENKERSWRQVEFWFYLKMCQAQRGEKFFGCGYVFFNMKGMEIIQCLAWIRTKFPDFPWPFTRDQK